MSAKKTSQGKAPKGKKATDAETVVETTPAPEATPPTEAPAKTKAPKARVEPKPKKVSALDAAAKVLGEQGKPMNCQEMIEEMSKKKYWTSPNGATPGATLYAAIIREIKVKGKEARFEKAERGKFATSN